MGETDEPPLLPDGIDPPKAHLAKAPGPFDLPEHRLHHRLAPPVEVRPRLAFQFFPHLFRKRVSDRPRWGDIAAEVGLHGQVIVAPEAGVAETFRQAAERAWVSASKGRKPVSLGWEPKVQATITWRSSSTATRVIGLGFRWPRPS